MIKDNSIVGIHAKRYKKIYFLLMVVVSVFEFALFIRGIIVFKNYSTRKVLYLLSYSFLFIASLASATFLYTAKYKEFRIDTYSLVLKLYVAAILLWSLIIAYLDMGYGTSPIVYLTVIVTVAGVVVLEPMFYIPALLISSGIVVGLDAINEFIYFKSASEFINFFIFVSMALIINVRHYVVSMREHKATTVLEASVLEERNRVSTISLQTIKSISNAVDAKDKYTREHSQRVAEYTKIIAESLNWEDAKVKEIHEIALLHDIGKIGVPDSILNNPGKLTAEEFEQMKQHTVIGGEILRDLTILKNVDLGAKYHHERFDGTGYPSKLKGLDIPIEARIIAVADAFDAMNSNRVYRNKLTKEKIIEELINGKGKQFDPDIIDVFLPKAKEILELK